MGRISGLGIGIVLGFLGFAAVSTRAQLEMGYYSESCPEAESIVREFVGDRIRNAPSLAAALLRMHFHDCFVRVWFLSLSSLVSHECMLLSYVTLEKFGGIIYRVSPF